MKLYRDCFGFVSLLYLSPKGKLCLSRVTDSISKQNNLVGKNN